MKYAIIGAGPMGLCMARNLQRVGVEFTVFEISHDVGGLWDIDNPTSTMYESAHLISSKTMTEFSEFPMNDDVAVYPHHAQLKHYFQSYAKQFRLYDHIQFAHQVLHSEPKGEQWELSVKDLSTGETRTERFDGLLIANGTLHKPNQPALPGEFTGHVMHSSEYKSADVFAGKRVLIIGCGNSGADIAVDALHRAASVDISVRRGYYFLPKFVMGKPIDTLGGKLSLPRPIKQLIDGTIVKLLVGQPENYGLPKPDYKMYESHPVINSLLLHHLGHGDIGVCSDLDSILGDTVTFKDGSKKQYDLILQATGYLLDYPFIDAKHLNWSHARPGLYLNAMHPEYDNLFVMGMVEAAGLGWQGRDEQAELVARYIVQRARGAKSAARLAAKKKADANKRLDGGMNYLKLDRMAYYVHKDTYRKQVKAHIEELKSDWVTSPNSPVATA